MALFLTLAVSRIELLQPDLELDKWLQPEFVEMLDRVTKEFLSDHKDEDKMWTSKMHCKATSRC